MSPKIPHDRMMVCAIDVCLLHICILHCYSSVLLLFSFQGSVFYVYCRFNFCFIFEYPLTVRTILPQYGTMHVTYLPSHSFFPLISLVEIFSLRFLSCCWPGIFECTLFICTPPHAISFIPLTHHTEHFLLFHLSYRSASIIPLSPTLLHASLASRPHPSPPSHRLYI